VTVENGPFPTESSHIFSKLMKYGEEADYNPSYSFTEEDFQKLRDETQGLSERTNDYLTEKGYLEEKLLPSGGKKVGSLRMKIQSDFLTDIEKSGLDRIGHDSGDRPLLPINGEFVLNGRSEINHLHYLTAQEIGVRGSCLF